MADDFISDAQFEQLQRRGQVQDHGPAFISDADMGAIDSSHGAGNGRDDNPDLLAQAGRGIAGALGYINNKIDPYTGAPVRAAVGAAQDSPDLGSIPGSAAKAFGKQWGEDPSLAPTGKQIAARAGLSTDSVLSPGAQKAAAMVLKNSYAGYVAERMFPGSIENMAGASPAGIAGAGIDAATNPVSYLPVEGAINRIAQGAGDLAGGPASNIAGKLASKAEALKVKALGATGREAQAFEPGAGRLLLDNKMGGFWSDPAAIAEKVQTAFEKSGTNIGDILTTLDARGGNVPTSDLVAGLRARAGAMDPAQYSVKDSLNRLADRIEADANARTARAGAKPWMDPGQNAPTLYDNPATQGALRMPSSSSTEALNLPGTSPAATHLQDPLAADPQGDFWTPTGRHNSLPPGSPSQMPEINMEYIPGKPGVRLGKQVRTDLGSQQALPLSRSVQGPQLPDVTMPGTHIQEALPLPVVKVAPDSIPLTAAEMTKRRFQAGVNYNSSPAETSAAEEAADAYRQAVEDRATAMDPALAQRFQRDKELYGLLKPLKEAAQKRAFTLQQSPHGGLLDIAAAGAGADVGGMLGGPMGAVIGGASGLGVKAMRPRFASMGATTTDALANAVMKTPQALGQYAAPLAAAAQRGPAVLSAMHNALMQADPQYSEQLERVLGQGAQASRTPATPATPPARGEAAWAQRGLEALGVSDPALSSRLMQDPKARALLIQAGGVSQGSKAMKAIQSKLQKGWGTP